MDIANYNSPIARNIACIIKQKGLKKYVVASKLGYSTQAFSDMLNGRRIIKAKDIPTIASILGVTLNDLFE